MASNDTENPKPKKGNWKPLDWNASPASGSGSLSSIATSEMRDAGVNNPHPRRGPRQNWHNRARGNNGNGYYRNQNVDSLTKAMNNISLAMNRNAKNGTLQASTAQPSTTHPLTEFTVFGKLPVELQLKIWSMHCHSSSARLLEVERDKARASSFEDDVSHRFACIAPRSSKTPAVLHTCRNAREEALKVWKCEDFNQLSDFAHVENPRRVWFNVEKDIVYFGEGNCMATLVNFLDARRWNKQIIPRIAILCSGALFNCCDYDHDDYFHGPDQYECDLGISMAGGCTPMQALHGIDWEISWSGLSGGCEGLKEVFWVVPTKLMPMTSGKIDDTIGMRPAVGDGLTTGQIKWKRRIELDIERVENGDGLERVGDNKWVGDDKPSFQWVSLAPLPTAKGKVYDAMNISSKEEGKLKYKKGEIIRNVQKWSRCQITLCEKEYPAQKELEIGFYGTVEGIAYAKTKIVDMLKEVNKNLHGGSTYKGKGKN